jgi:hypothetical protein
VPNSPQLDTVAVGVELNAAVSEVSESDESPESLELPESLESPEFLESPDFVESPEFLPECVDVPELSAPPLPLALLPAAWSEADPVELWAWQAGPADPGAVTTGKPPKLGAGGKVAAAPSVVVASKQKLPAGMLAGH